MRSGARAGLGSGLGSGLAERLLFLRAFVAHPRLVGAVLPTSARAVSDMLDLADLSKARTVVELGAGTGVYTGEILARLPNDARLIALEIDPRLARLLQQRFPDPRLQVACDSAENLETYLGGTRADVIVSGLPFTSLGESLTRRILDRSRAALDPAGALLVLQYSPLVRRQLQRSFGSVRLRFCLRNVPPAFLFACTSPAPAPSAPLAPPGAPRC